MELKSKIELTLRAAVISAELLQLTKSNSKLHAKLVVAEAAKQFMELDKIVEALPEDSL
jgi:hypothetical protein